MTTFGSILSDAIAKNLRTYVNYALRCLDHQGAYRSDNLWTVKRNSDGRLSLGKGLLSTEFRTCLIMGGEIPNSFLPLYELAYFFECVALAAVATVTKRCVRLEEILGAPNAVRDQRLREALLDASPLDWEQALMRPEAAIVCALDADLIPVRYGKHQLWQIPAELKRTRCQNILTKELNGTVDRTLAGQYWCDEDEEIALRSIQNTEDLNRAKALQVVLALEPFAADMGIDLCTYPFYFSYSPKEELVSLGEGHRFFDFLSELHSPRERLKLKAITGRTYPWCISIACPVCGQASKRVIQSRLLPNGKTIEIRCKEKDHFYQNEFGAYFVQRGCGSRKRFEIGDTPHEIFSFIKNKDITLYYPIKTLLALLLDSSCCPVVNRRSNLTPYRRPILTP